MLAFLRLKALQRIFGEGPSAAMGAAILSSVLHRVSSAVTSDTERLDTAHLRPGEKYTVMTRPPYSREERKARARRDKLAASYASATKPSRAARKIAKKHASAQRKVDRTDPKSPKWDARAAEANRFVDRYEAATAPSAKAKRIAKSLAEAEIAVDAARGRTLAKASSKRRAVQKRPPRAATFE